MEILKVIIFFLTIVRKLITKKHKSLKMREFYFLTKNGANYRAPSIGVHRTVTLPSVLAVHAKKLEPLYNPDGNLESVLCFQ